MSLLAATTFLHVVCFSCADARGDIISGLAHLWDFENNLNDSVGTLNGVSIGSSGFVTGKVGAGSVNLTGGYVGIASPVIANQQNNYTWSAWFNRNTNVHGYIVESTPNFTISAVALDGSQLRTHIEGGAGGAASWRYHDDTLTSPVDWNLIVVTYDGSLTDGAAGSVYLNGNLTSHVDQVWPGFNGDITPLASTTGLHIGANRGGTGLFAGQLDQVAIWNRTLSAADVTQLFNSGSGINLTAAVPEPSSFILLVLSGLGWCAYRRKVSNSAVIF